MLKGAIESADFWALKFMKKKNMEQNEWYKLFQIAVVCLRDFIMEEYAMGLTFNFNGENKWNLLLSGQVSATSPA